ncbi:DUF4097 family beta strand repeat-containing protein [Portibacter lacus]|uniref:DUF4097 domain-containing protein n=1 Tax=Portibacter lacus TaxID=1099794 RepID=A0AA37SPZ5_9BACT|nr:DUF4097 family beta strand repeat-containing protein [Portibacter lacus]GLR17392.1 hypothetical protein GCM10007940_20070 [Portibacter lacus]
MKIYSLVIAMILGTCMVSNAQNSKGEEIRVALSNPGSHGVLEASSHRGSMTVTAYDGNEVIVTLYADDDDKGKNKSKNGLKKISGGTVNAEISEGDNVVQIQTGSQNTVDVSVQVPRDFDVILSTHHNGDVYVKGIDGTSEINAHHGDVTLESVGSSANVNTHHGEIKATFRSVDSKLPMVLTTYHGDVDISLPPGANFNTKLKTTKGDIYTDYEIDMKTSVNKVESTGKGTKVEIGGWRHGVVGSGGQEYMLSSYHGDIIIRKN